MVQTQSYVRNFLLLDFLFKKEILKKKGMYNPTFIRRIWEYFISIALAHMVYIIYFSFRCNFCISFIITCCLCNELGEFAEDL